MIEKRNIINFLFIVTFPVYGVGTYIAATISPSIGYMVSMSPLISIIVFYCIDILYKREFSVRLNSVYLLAVLFQISCIASLFIALSKGLPDANFHLTVGRAVSILTPFHAFIVVALYNDDNKDKLTRLTLLGLSLLLLINLVGFFGLGMSNAFHSIEGRLSLPFFDGFYSGANVLAIINLILIHYLIKTWNHPLRFAFLLAYFTLNLILFYQINSRLSILIFLLVLALFFLKLIRSKGVFFISLFTVPILLSSATLLYNILQHPLFVSVIQRVDVEDVTTFNGRAYLWHDALDWLLHDQRGLFFGNGYKAHYFLDMIPDVVKLWNAEDSHHLHLHSTSLETVVCQGIVFLVLLYILFFVMYRYYRRKYAEDSEQGAFFPVVVFLLFIMQVDTFLYLDSLGSVIFALMISRTVLKDPIALDSIDAIQLSGLRSGENDSIQPGVGGTSAVVLKTDSK